MCHSKLFTSYAIPLFLTSYGFICVFSVFPPLSPYIPSVVSQLRVSTTFIVTDVYLEVSSFEVTLTTNCFDVSFSAIDNFAVFPEELNVVPFPSAALPVYDHITSWLGLFPPNILDVNSRTLLLSLLTYEML